MRPQECDNFLVRAWVWGWAVPQSSWKGLEGRVALAHSGLMPSEKAVWPALARRAQSCMCGVSRSGPQWTTASPAPGQEQLTSGEGVQAGQRGYSQPPVSGAQQCDDEALGSQAPGEGGGQDLVPTKGLGTV